MTTFYKQEELNLLYQELKTIPYAEKNEWQRYLSNQASRESKKRKRKNQIEKCTEYIEHY